MLDFQQKRKVKSFIYNRVTIWVLFAVLLLTIHSTWKVYQKQRESEALVLLSQKKAGDLEKRNIEIKQKIQSLDAEEGVEKEIRSKFNVVKGAESMVVVLDENNQASGTMATTSSSFWQKLSNIFKW